MGLVKCAACSREISEAATACPGCGHPAPKRTSGFTKFVASVFAVGGGLWILSSIFAEPTPAKPPCPATDAQCAFNQADSKLHIGCKTAIEAEALFNARWTDNILTRPVFSRVGWADQKARVLLVMGDEIEFQNAAGNYLRSSYSCEYDTQTRRVVRVDTSPGRLR